MREIKFRAWDAEMKRMRVTGMGINRGVITADSDTIIMQFTGLKDREGKEIYHKDLFRDSTGISVVEWNDRLASWCLRRNGWAFDHFFGEAVDPEHGEVIGNIYEKVKKTASQFNSGRI